MAGAPTPSAWPLGLAADAPAARLRRPIERPGPRARPPRPGDRLPPGQGQRRGPPALLRVLLGGDRAPEALPAAPGVGPQVGASMQAPAPRAPPRRRAAEAWPRRVDGSGPRRRRPGDCDETAPPRVELACSPEGPAIDWPSAIASPPREPLGPPAQSADRGRA